MAQLGQCLESAALAVALLQLVSITMVAATATSTPSLPGPDLRACIPANNTADCFCPTGTTPYCPANFPIGTHGKCFGAAPRKYHALYRRSRCEVLWNSTNAEVENQREADLIALDARGNATWTKRKFHLVKGVLKVDGVPYRGSFLPWGKGQPADRDGCIRLKLEVVKATNTSRGVYTTGSCRERLTQYCQVSPLCDVNECHHGNPCPSNSTCKNTMGSYKCEAKPSFPDHCQPNPCPPHSTCQNDLTGYTCVCDAGYAATSLPAPTRCVVNECLTNPCPTASTCTNTIESFVCTCNPGFVEERTLGRSAFNCVVDVCHSNPCPPGFMCTQALGVYSCTCPADTVMRTAKHASHALYCPSPSNLELFHPGSPGTLIWRKFRAAQALCERRGGTLPPFPERDCAKTLLSTAEYQQTLTWLNLIEANGDAYVSVTEGSGLSSAPGSKSVFPFFCARPKVVLCVPDTVSPVFPTVPEGTATQSSEFDTTTESDTAATARESATVEDISPQVRSRQVSSSLLLGRLREATTAIEYSLVANEVCLMDIGQSPEDLGKKLREEGRLLAEAVDFTSLSVGQITELQRAFEAQPMSAASVADAISAFDSASLKITERLTAIQSTLTKLGADIDAAIQRGRTYLPERQAPANAMETIEQDQQEPGKAMRSARRSQEVREGTGEIREEPVKEPPNEIAENARPISPAPIDRCAARRSKLPKLLSSP